MRTHTFSYQSTVATVGHTTDERLHVHILHPPRQGVSVAETCTASSWSAVCRNRLDCCLARELTLTAKQNMQPQTNCFVAFIESRGQKQKIIKVAIQQAGIEIVAWIQATGLGLGAVCASAWGMLESARSSLLLSTHSKKRSGRGPVSARPSSPHTSCAVMGRAPVPLLGSLQKKAEGSVGLDPPKPSFERGGLECKLVPFFPRLRRSKERLLYEV